ncbi:MAG: efflux RND transporter permease subunit [Aulosira sp. DedQUE10]|nr:efflux RND transporter permease subunit [Aulosira sp. DedQUE10]
MAIATQKTVPVQLQAIGNVQSGSTVQITPQASGQIVGVYFKKGQEVKKGQLLFTLDVRHQEKIVDILRQDPNIDALNSTVGASGPNASVNSGRITIRLKPREQRQLNAEQIIAELTPKLRRTPGIQAFMRAPAAIPIGGQQTNSQYQFTLQSLNLQDLHQLCTPIVR